MQITLKSLKALNPCEDGYKWCHKNFKKGKNDLAEIIWKLNEEHNDWANWLIVRHMTHEQKVMYAIFAAEQVIGIYENKYSDDKRLRKAIEAAKKYLKTKTAAAAAAYAAYAAYTDAYADAADAAAAAAAAAADAADADAAADAADADAAADAADVKSEMQKRILTYGLSLIEKE